MRFALKKIETNIEKLNDPKVLSCISEYLVASINNLLDIQVKIGSESKDLINHFELNNLIESNMLNQAEPINRNNDSSNSPAMFISKSSQQFSHGQAVKQGKVFVDRAFISELKELAGLEQTKQVDSDELLIWLKKKMDQETGENIGQSAETPMILSQNNIKRVTENLAEKSATLIKKITELKKPTSRHVLQFVSEIDQQRQEIFSEFDRMLLDFDINPRNNKLHTAYVDNEYYATAMSIRVHLLVYLDDKQALEAAKVLVETYPESNKPKELLERIQKEVKEYQEKNEQTEEKYNQFYH